MRLTKPTHCAKHRTEDMICSGKQLCIEPDCDNTATSNFPNCPGKVTCLRHSSEWMNNKNHWQPNRITLPKNKTLVEQSEPETLDEVTRECAVVMESLHETSVDNKIWIRDVVKQIFKPDENQTSIFQVPGTRYDRDQDRILEELVAKVLCDGRDMRVVLFHARPKRELTSQISKAMLREGFITERAMESRKEYLSREKIILKCNPKPNTNSFRVICVSDELQLNELKLTETIIILISKGISKEMLSPLLREFIAPVLLVKDSVIITDFPVVS